MQFNSLVYLATFALSATSSIEFCSAEFKPVCAQWGKWYSNECELKKAGKTLSTTLVYSAATKTCVEKGTPVIEFCSAEFKPVCAKWGKWYSNECELKKAGKILSTTLVYSAATKTCVKK